LPASPNSWDNGTHGNYWSDYLTRYPNASENADTGTGDTPFYINENNADQHPLMEPVQNVNLDEEPNPTISETPSAEQTASPTATAASSASPATSIAIGTPGTQNTGFFNDYAYFAVVALVALALVLTTFIVFRKKTCNERIGENANHE
jgi:hypothetical protein